MRRKLGQHFLIDQEIITRILDSADIRSEDQVLEIGPGKGDLTFSLARQAKQLIAVEYDPQLAEELRRQFTGQDHVRIVRADARYLRYEELFPESPAWSQRVKIVANLPYYAAVPIVLSIFRYPQMFSTCTLMFQKEVAERITASPGNKSYGSLSVVAQYYSKPEYCFSVSPRAFRPRPKVESAVITLRFLDQPRVEVLDPEFFFQLVKYAFLTRRKTLKNSLAKHGAGLFPADLLQQAFESLHLHPYIRGEELSVEDFANLSNVLIQLQHRRPV